MTLVEAPRNTIHDAALALHTVSGHESRIGDSRRTFHVSVFDDAAAGVYTKTRMWEAAGRLGTPEQWGLYESRHDDGIQVDPWLYANTLVATTTPVINRIAALIGAMQQFGVDSSAVDLVREAPHDQATGTGVRRVWGLPV
jgi:hypothetical protein